MCYIYENESSHTIWQDIENFPKPKCPNDCPMAHAPTLDQDGYFCEYCDVEISNGWEFDAAIKAFDKALERESKIFS